MHTYTHINISEGPDGIARPTCGRAKEGPTVVAAGYRPLRRGGGARGIPIGGVGTVYCFGEFSMKNITDFFFAVGPFKLIANESLAHCR